MRTKYPRAAPAGMMSIVVEMASSRLPDRMLRAATSAAAAATVSTEASTNLRRSWARMGLGTVKAKAESLWRP